jgi:hypothetical protein
MSAPILDADMLSALEERLRAQDAPVVHSMRPGLTEPEINKVLAPLGLRLPIEARLWWGWHDGAKYPRHELIPGQPFLSLAEAVDSYLLGRTIAKQVAEPDLLPPMNDPDFRWNPAWLPITGDRGHPTVIDCSVAEGEPTPLRVIDGQDVDGFFKPKAPSLGQMVTWWIQTLDEGICRWDRQNQRWENHWERLDDERRISCLV